MPGCWHLICFCKIVAIYSSQPKPSICNNRRASIRNKFAAIPALLVLVSVGTLAEDSPAVTPKVPSGHAVLWKNPKNIESLDLIYGAGGRDRMPKGTLTFMKEDSDGTNPKLVVRDESGLKWKLKFGAEARPEVAAARLLWAVGYFTGDDYYRSDVRVEALPAQLHRGESLLGPDRIIPDARLKPDHDDCRKSGTWKWKDNPFTGTRELNGLRVMMALIDNWDLKDANNAVCTSETGEQIYMISDLGAAFGPTHLVRGLENSRGNVAAYSESQFLNGSTADTVSFVVPARPTVLAVVNPSHYLMRVNMEWIGKNIPRADARWMGQILSRLSDTQIRDAFQTAGYSPAEVEVFVRVVQRRIAVLNGL
jgi:hypothetical protein